MAKKICGQVNTPEVDDTLKDCNTFLPSKCITVSYKSSVVKNRVGGSMDEYLKLWDEKFSKISNQLYYLTQVVELLTPPEGIGIFPPP